MPDGVQTQDSHGMVTPLPVETAREIAQAYGCDALAFVARCETDGTMFVVTWGAGDTADSEAKHFAAEMGDRIKAALPDLLGEPLNDGTDFRKGDPVVPNAG